MEILRFYENPILAPADVHPSDPRLEVACVLNPGVFRWNDEICLLLRVAEKAPSDEQEIRIPVLNAHNHEIQILSFDKNDPDLELKDPRVFYHRRISYLTTLSHLRLARSKDGVRFTVDPTPLLAGQGHLESFGIEDCRVTEIEGRFYLTYSAVSPYGVGVGMISTENWNDFERHGMILPPHNKDCALFPEKIQGAYSMLHRPSGAGIGGNYIWISKSEDLVHWGEHCCILQTRHNMWDCARVGAGSSPIRTPEGWLEIYHGANDNNRYCLGAILLDAENPEKVLARSQHPIMEPITEYERKGFFGEVIFTNGQILEDDCLTIYYGAADEVVCGARLSIRDILDSLR